MTREEAIKKHRELWHWIANEHRKRKRCEVRNNENPDVAKEKPFNDCWLCEYARQFDKVGSDSYCNMCPINWGSETCLRYGSPYAELAFGFHLDYEELADLADIIAELPER